MSHGATKERKDFLLKLLPVKTLKICKQRVWAGETKIQCPLCHNFGVIMMTKLYKNEMVRGKHELMAHVHKEEQKKFEYFFVACIAR